MQRKTNFQKSATQRVEPYCNATQKIETSSICLRRAATTPADFALQNFHAMFFDKQKITCDPLRIFSAALLETEFCLRCGTEFSRKDFVKREKRCVTNVALRYLLVEIPL